MTAAMTLVTGALLVLMWLPNRGDAATPLWGAGCIACGAGLLVAVLRETLPALASLGVGNALIVLGYALLWAGTRRFDGRSLPVAALVAAPAAGLGFSLLPGIGDDVGARLAVAAAIGAVFFALSAYDLWRGRAERLQSRLPTAILLAVHAVALVGRVVLQAFAPPNTVLADAGRWTALSLMEGTLVLVAGSFLLLAMGKERVEAQARHAATHDPLTGLGNRRAFLAAAEGARAASRRDGAPLSLVLIDLDHFKAINDRHGHPAGDSVLCAFAGAVSPTLASGDLFARLGGDEFAILLPGRDATTAAALVERLRPLVAASGRSRPWEAEAPSLSAGVASLRPGGSIEALFAEADRALYLAKAAGRDRVVQLPAAVG